jgi:acyl-CoA synthetase (AMP-forming)/AMP-acid ligase II
MMTTIPAQSLPELLRARAEQNPQATAIAALERPMLTYGGLFKHVENMVYSLNSMGIGRDDRVAIVLPNGPEMAVVFLAVACGATSAPLNPAYGSNEFDFYLADLNAKALILQSGLDSPARLVAEARHIPIIELSPQWESGAGVFRLSGVKDAFPARPGFAGPEDIALVLHTSGTTSRPKIVPLTHQNICNSADNTSRSLALTEKDRCLNIMPLFHIHGLIGATLSSITAGASIVCTPGMDATRFFEWLDILRPTWYTAVPTMHQAILGQAADYTEVIVRSPLRLIRSCSAPLPPKVMEEMESVFHTPVLESYGMTEAAHQMASNPLPPQARKPGSVGLAAGPQVAIMDEAGNLFPQGTLGEIVIRGANVMHGYENNPQANKSSFHDGWFRTGDQGYFDVDGYLFLTSRIKEIINRGGEKIAPREVDEAFMDHPAVAQAVTFAIPHSTLGEDMATAVMLKKGASVSEKELRNFAFARLASHKVPSQVIIVDQIPKGATGKLQRIGLSEKLADYLKPQLEAPRSATEAALANLWVKVLGHEPAGIHENFFTSGGDSLLATRLNARIRAAFQVDLPANIIFREPTIAELAVVVEHLLLDELEKLSEEDAQTCLNDTPMK